MRFLRFATLSGSSRFRGWMVAVLAFVATMVFAEPALAHANLVRSEPQSNASVDQSPPHVQLWFSERPEPKLTEVQVYDARRQRVDSGPAAVAGDDAQSLIEPLRPGLPRGVYTVSWRATSAVDGHVTGGAFAFGVGVTPSPADLGSATLAASSPGPGAFAPVIRWLGYLAAVGLLGMALFGLLVMEPAEADWQHVQDAAAAFLDRLHLRLRRLGQVLAALLFVSAAAMLVNQSVQSGGGLSTDALQATVGTTLGGILLARLAVAAVVLLLILPGGWALQPHGFSPHRTLGAAAASEMQARTVGADIERIGAIAALLAYLFLFALSSHALAVTSAPELALFVDWLHLTLAGMWIGGLLALAAAVVPDLGGWARRRADLQPLDFARNRLFGPLVAGFSRVALIAAAGLALTGAYQALVHVGSVDNALSTDYGRTLIVKTALFAAALLLAGFHRWFVVPALHKPAKAAATRARRLFSRTLPVEALLGIGILAATGVLTTLAPATNQSSGGIQTKTLGDLKVAFQVVPLQVGSNLFEVAVTSKGQPVDNAEKVELQFTMLDMDMGQGLLDLQPRGKGIYAAQGDLFSMSGHWRVDLLLRVPGKFDQRTSFDIDIKP